MKEESITLFVSEKPFVARLSIALIIFILLSLFMIFRDEIERLYAFWTALIGLALYISILIASALQDVPRLTLSPKGIRLTGLWRSQLWNWSEVGPFFVYVHRPKFKRYIYLFAYTDAHHDLLAAHSDFRTPTPSTADIGIPLFTFHAGKNEQTAQDFADEVNRWRDRYGAPEVTVDHENPRKQYDALTTQLGKKQVRFVAYIFAAAFVAAVIFGRGGVLDRLFN